MEIKPTDTKDIECAVRTILSYIGDNPEREGLQGTPERIMRMWKEIFRGYNETQAPKITTFTNGTDGISCTGVVADSGTYYSMCEHHMMPFFGKYWFAYIPNPKGKILGISKIGRVVDYCAARLQVQERLAQDVVTMIVNALGEEHPPLAVGVIMEGEHLCKTMRGVKKQGKMRSSFYFDNGRLPELRAELSQFVSYS
ncbi:GTP cyclohydrolase I [uncultured Bacteroides sp.]|jgi:GTP cyclohydrolase I|uniref:GTP cyclohydrolase I n=1 Tax=uncultured Bacteroides sp. TaxID=162156 RepID=UPI00280B81B9|nr:GTP cyclohydrolase I [uncultured Bacteroides sp.]